MKSLHIDRLDLRVRGVSPEAARAALDGLGEAVLRRIAAHGLPDAPPPGGDLDLGTARLPDGSAHGLRTTILARMMSDAWGGHHSVGDAGSGPA